MMLALELPFPSDLHVDTQNGWTVLASKNLHFDFPLQQKKLHKKI